MTSALTCTPRCTREKHDDWCLPFRVEQAKQAVSELPYEARATVLLTLGSLVGTIIRLERDADDRREGRT